MRKHVNSYRKIDVNSWFCSDLFWSWINTHSHPLILDTQNRPQHRWLSKFDQFICNFCKKNFSRRFNLKRHISTVHDYHCGICDTKFTEQRLWRNHISIYKDPSKMRFDCCKCNAKFSTLPNLAEHCESVHEIKIKVRL